MTTPEQTEREGLSVSFQEPAHYLKIVTPSGELVAQFNRDGTVEVGDFSHEGLVAALREAFEPWMPAARPATVSEPAPVGGDVRELLSDAIHGACRLVAHESDALADAILARFDVTPRDGDTVRDEWPLMDGERRTTLTEPMRGTGVNRVNCRECLQEIEAYCLVAIHGLSAGYRWRHVSDGGYSCAPSPVQVRPYDEYAAARALAAVDAANEEEER